VAPRRILSALAELQEPRVRVSFNDGQDRILFTGAGDGGLTFKYVTAPHR
jgi:hypothetical protein